MHTRLNPTAVDPSPADTTIRTRHATEVCVVCGHEHTHGRGRQVSCPECADGAGGSFLVRPKEAGR